MTLERHRSKLAPSIDFSGDGRLVLTDREGTFPLRLRDSKKVKGTKGDIDWDKKGGDKKSYDLNHGTEMQEKNSKNRWEYDPDYRIFDDLSSYRSFDPKRDAKRKYKPKNASNYEKAMREITGTISSAGSNSSLNRKLRKSRSHRRSAEMESRFGSLRSARSSDSEKRFRRGQTPRMSPEMRESLRRSNRRYRSLDIAELRKKKGLNGELNNNSFGTYGNGMINGKTSYLTAAYLDRNLQEETLPKVLFLVLGILLIICGLIRLVLSQWHEYFHPLWTGALLLAIAIPGFCHKGNYLDPAKNLSYIVFSALGSVATMVSVALILQVAVDLTRRQALQGNESDYKNWIKEVNFSEWEQPVKINTDQMLIVSLVLDYLTLLLNMFGFYSLRAMLIAIDNYMEATQHLTAQCDHRGNPRVFSPLDQMSFAQATMFVGLVVIYISHSNHYISPFWAPMMLVIAGFTSVFFGKRPDVPSLGWLSTILQCLSMAACGAATVLMTLGIVQSITALDNKDSNHKKPAELIVSACAQVLYILCMIVNIIFSVGVAFRHIRVLCCARCLNPEGDVSDVYRAGPYDIRF